MLSKDKIKALPLAYRCLSSLYSRSFGVYTNESLKNDFEEKLKEKYFSQQSQANQAPNPDQMNLYDEMKEAYKDIFDKFQSKDSILRAYKRQITKDPGNIKDQQFSKEAARYLVEGENHFRGITTDEFMNRSKKFMEAQITGQGWSPTYKPDISEGNLNYQKYNKNFVKMRDAVKTDDAHTEEFSLGTNMVNFIKNLDDNMQEKKIFKDINARIKDKIKNPLLAAKKIEEHWQRAGCGLRAKLLSRKKRNRINIGQAGLDKDHVRPIYGRVSPWAKEEIYKLHLDGWSVRDISVRYGLLPERVKFIIWAKQYFYDEVMPNVDLQTVELGLEREMIYSRHFPWMDYGKDLYIIAQREKGLHFQRFRVSEIDANPPKEIQEKMEKHLEGQGKRAYDVVTEGFIGHGNKGYYIKSLIVNSGHGSERVNKKFKMIVQHSKNNPQLIPDRARTKLNQGPRIASLGYGIK